MPVLPEASAAYLVRNVPWIGDRVASAAIERNLEQALALNGREEGATVFVIGSGPQLNDLTPRDMAALENHPTIGVNRTQYAVDLSYFLSAYPAEVMLARKRCGADTTYIHIRPQIGLPLIRDTLTIRRVRHQQGQQLAHALRAPIPTLHTFKNVALAATHLALVLGALRVVFVGVEQRSAVHFYDVRPDLRGQMAQDIRRIRAKSLFTTDHPYATEEALLARLVTPPKELLQREFYPESHAGKFREFFGELNRHGVEVYATTPNSVIAEAGAQIVRVEKALSW